MLNLRLKRKNLPNKVKHPRQLMFKYLKGANSGLTINSVSTSRLPILTANYSRKLTDKFGNTAEQKFKNLAYLCTNALDVVKKEWPSMKISSGLRDFVPPGGATKSQHLTGEAVDIQFPGLDRKGLVERAKQISGMIPYDQLLLEFNTPGGNGWIHISLKESPRGQAFTMNNHKKVSGDGEFVLVA